MKKSRAEWEREAAAIDRAKLFEDIGLLIDVLPESEFQDFYKELSNMLAACELRGLIAEHRQATGDPTGEKAYRALMREFNKMKGRHAPA